MGNLNPPLRRKLIAAKKKRERLEAELKSLRQELRELVVEGFESGMDGPDLARLAGVSKARLYQIRDGVR